MMFTKVVLFVASMLVTPVVKALAVDSLSSGPELGIVRRGASGGILPGGRLLGLGAC